METLFLITNIFSLRSYLDSNHYLVSDGGVNLTVREWLYWSSRDGINNNNPSICTPIDGVVSTDCGALIYPIGERVGRITTLEDEFMMQGLFS